MATLLILVIFLSYIALGVPDSLFGAAWPAMYEAFSVPVSFGGAISVVCSVCTFLSSLCSDRLLARFGTYCVTLVSALLTALSLFLVSVTENFAFVLLLCVPLGLGAGAIDSGLNGFVALHYSARQMNFLHCFYGVGVVTSPVLVSLALGSDGGFRRGFFWVSLLLFGITLILGASFPLWRKQAEAREEPMRHVPLSRMVTSGRVVSMWLLFFSSCALEFTCGTWGATYLVEVCGMPPALGAGFVTLYYAGITLGRFVAGLLASRVKSERLILFSACIAALSLVLLVCFGSRAVCCVLLFFIGFGNGPIYPNLMNLVPLEFPRESAQSLMGSFLAAACLGITVAPPIFGAVGEAVSLSVFPLYLAALFSVFMLVLPFFLRGLKRGKDWT